MIRAQRQLTILACIVLVLAWTGIAGAQDVNLGIITVKQRALADSIRAQLLKGASFESLAKKSSVGPASSRGGRLGVIPMNRLRSEYRSALSGLGPGRPSRVVPTEEGYTVLMRFDKPTAKAATPTSSTAPTPPPSRAVKSGPRPPASGPALLAARSEVMAGLEAMAAGEIKNSVVHMQRAVKKNPSEDTARFLLAMLQERRSGVKAKRAIKALAVGFVSVTDGQLDSALEHFRQARLDDPKLWQAALMEANAMAGVGKLVEAQAMLDNVLRMNPNSARAYLSKGQLTMETGKHQEATEYFNKAIALDPKLAEPYYHLAALAVVQGKRDVAESNLKAALKHDPYMAEAYSDLGLLYAAGNHLAKAAKAYKKALMINPEFAGAHINLGIIYVRQNNLTAAIVEFKKAINIRPQMAVAHANLASAYAIRKQWPEAIEHADIAVKLGMKVSPELLKTLATHRR